MSAPLPTTPGSASSPAQQKSSRVFGPKMTPPPDRVPGAQQKSMAKVEEMSAPEQMTPARNIPFTDSIFALVDKDPKCIAWLPIEEVETRFTQNRGCYEITWAKSDDELCRAYVDVDGQMLPDTSESDFDTMSDAVEFVLAAIDFGTPFSLMKAPGFRNTDWKDKTVKNKLSFRITFTHKCGTKENVKTWTRDVIAPKIKEALKGVIPFYIKGVDKLPAEGTVDFLDWDNSVYRSHGKMRVWNSSKPNEHRYNVLVKGEFIDTLINYIPEGCETIVAKQVKAKVASAPVASAPVASAPVPRAQAAAPADSEEEPLTPEKKQIVDIMGQLDVSVADDYTSWLSVGMACFNEDIPLSAWRTWSMKSAKFNHKRDECAEKWATFKKGNLSQSYIWALLKKSNPPAFKTLASERTDFEKLIVSPTHYSVAEYFYNTRPSDYLYDAVSGWFGVLPSNIWEHTRKAVPATIRTIIVRVFNAERIQLEVATVKKKMAVQADSSLSEKEKKDKLERLDKVTERCLKFKNQFECDTFLKGTINFLAGFYAEQSQLLMAAKGAKVSEGILSVFDTNPNVFAFTDCLYDFKLKEFRPVKQTDYLTITCGYARPEANPEVRALIMETLLGIWEDVAMRDYFLTVLSSCICGVRNMEVFNILTGRGGNGKGLCWDLVQATFGGYYYELPKTCLTKPVDSSTSATPYIAALRGMRCVGTSEPEAEEKLQEGTIKLLTGGDLLTGRMLYGEPTTFKPQFGLYIQCNNIPVFNQVTKGGVRRNRVNLFPFSFVAEPKLSYERKGNPYIKNVLCRSAEWRDEFFNILLDYYALAEGKSIDGIPTPPAVSSRTNEYIEDNNRVGTWWASKYEIVEGACVSSREALADFVRDTGVKMGDREFKAALAFNDIDIKKMNSQGPMKGKMGIMNYKIREETE